MSDVIVVTSDDDTDVEAMILEALSHALPVVTWEWVVNSLTTGAAAPLKHHLLRRHTTASTASASIGDDDTTNHSCDHSLYTVTEVSSAQEASTSSSSGASTSGASVPSLATRSLCSDDDHSVGDVVGTSAGAAAAVVPSSSESAADPNPGARPSTLTVRSGVRALAWVTLRRVPSMSHVRPCATCGCMWVI